MRKLAFFSASNGLQPTLGLGWRSLWSPLRMRQSLRGASAAHNTQNLSGLQGPTGRSDDHVYDLYAVCNHHGTGLIGGHYTGPFSYLIYLMNIKKWENF